VPRALVIINPVSGPRRRAVEAQVALARDLLGHQGHTVEVVVTKGRGDAHDASWRAREAGLDIVVAWGGDGTINEAGSALAFSGVPLAIVPGGSGNGLARDLGVPLEARAALELAATGRARAIDAGEIDGRALFFNVAGVGLDAAIAARLARRDALRGLAGYVKATLSELPRYRACPYAIRFDGRHTIERPAWFVALANSRQYGHGAQIAPAARLDDGRLDLVVVEPQSLGWLLRRLPALFRGTLTGGPGLHMSQMQEAVITGSGPLGYHVDGEPGAGGASIRVAVRPAALRIVAAKY